MKTALKNKKNTLILMITLGICLGVYSCKKDSAGTTTPTTVTEADAVEVTTDAVVPTNAGLLLQVNNAVSAFQNTPLSCGLQKDSTISRSSVTGATPSYSSVINLNYLLTCSGQTPIQLAFNFTGTNAYDGPRMTANDTSTGTFVLTGFLAANYTLNSTYTRNGSHTSKIGKGNTFTSKLIIVSSNILVDKTSLEVLSGTATVTLTGSSTSGKTFSYAGTITFLGTKKAKLVLNSGTSYDIKW